MRRTSATTGLIVKASFVLEEIVGVLSGPERGMSMRDSGTFSRRVSSWRTRVEISRSEFAIFPLRLVNKTKYTMISDGQGCRQTRL